MMRNVIQSFYIYIINKRNEKTYIFLFYSRRIFRVNRLDSLDQLPIQRGSSVKNRLRERLPREIGMGARVEGSSLFQFCSKDDNKREHGGNPL